jgi:hypothetical protein
MVTAVAALAAAKAKQNAKNFENNAAVITFYDRQAFQAETPKPLFKLPGPINGNLGNISRDGQRFVFAINVPAR